MTVDLHTLTGAYAAHAVDAAESAEFEEHLRECPACQQETRELVATTARIGEAEFAPPPPELKARIMADDLLTQMYYMSKKGGTASSPGMDISSAAPAPVNRTAPPPVSGAVKPK